MLSLAPVPQGLVRSAVAQPVSERFAFALRALVSVAFGPPALARFFVTHVISALFVRPAVEQPAYRHLAAGQQVTAQPAPEPPAY